MQFQRPLTSAADFDDSQMTGLNSYTLSTFMPRIRLASKAPSGK